MIFQRDPPEQLVGAIETMEVADTEPNSGSRQLLRFLVVYVPLELILLLALVAAVQAQSTAEQLLKAPEGNS